MMKVNTTAYVVTSNVTFILRLEKDTFVLQNITGTKKQSVIIKNNVLL